jgi:hypothetical protein
MILVAGPITIKEIEHALRICGKEKVPGSSGLTVRPLCRSNIAKLLVLLFVKSIKYEKVPKKWCKICMILIPKGNNPYTGIVLNLHPITLLKTIQKMIINTVFNPITNTLVKKSIFKGANTFALPGLPHPSLYFACRP